MKTLIIIDVQNDFIPGGSLEITNGDRIIPIINELQEQFDLVVATQDWHPQEHMSFASNHSDKKPFEKAVVQGMEETLWPNHCVQGTRGAEFHPELQTNRIAAIFRKGMDPKVDSYSGFYDNHHKISTGLSGYLREKGVTKIHFCGLAADICVYFTIKDAISEGFSAILIEDASQPLNMKDFESIKKWLIAKGVKIKNSQDILKKKKDGPIL
ncbi:MAG: bifunctional nicotinamidase/pyrazinamidase [Verrucomicrobia bacterium]|nr:bifunctional nicotinamidase/pyrazinamidase [Prolixibacteraceae bacterium]